MKQEQNAALRVSGWLMTAATLLLSALLIVQCLHIYCAGIAPDNLTDTGVRIHAIYSREIIANSWWQVAWAFWLWLGALLMGWAAYAHFPKAAHHAAPARLREPPALHASSHAGYVRMILIALAVILIALGIGNGGMHDVLVKAGNICTECIGLG